MKVFVGTSGWLYDWNEDGTLDWYVENSGLNAVELNASFYRFPFQNQVKSWKRKSKSLRWAIKVHRSITHLRKFGERAYDIWDKFKNLFNPLEDLIDFYLFQLPPNYSCREESLKILKGFTCTQTWEKGSQSSFVTLHASKMILLNGPRSSELPSLHRFTNSEMDCVV